MYSIGGGGVSEPNKKNSDTFFSTEAKETIIYQGEQGLGRCNPLSLVIFQEGVGSRPPVPTSGSAHGSLPAENLPLEKLTTVNVLKFRTL